jgi:bloom syndrome protein
LKVTFPNIPITALTATATPKVKNDILNTLKMSNYVNFTSSFNRPNLLYEVRKKNKSTIDDIVQFINSKYKNKVGIIYCLSRNETEQVAEKLKVRLALEYLTKIY